MAQFELQLKLKFTLKKTALISIAERLWTSKDVEDQILTLDQEDKFYNTYGSFENMSYADGWRKLADLPNTYIYWEEVADFVLNKTNSFDLPLSLKKDLQDIIVLIGERIYCYFTYRAGCHDNVIGKEFHSCYFTPYGTIIETTPRDNFDINSLENLFKRVFFYCDEDVIYHYRNEIIDYLENFQPGLKNCLINKKDIAFNIKCAWLYIFEWINCGDGEKIPEEYLKNEDYIIPLQTVSEMLMLGHYNLNCRTAMYLCPKLHSLGIASGFSDVAHSYIRYHDPFNTRLHIRYPPPDLYIVLINLMQSDEKYKFIKKYINEIIIKFLPAWPYQEVVLQILDMTQDFDYDFKFLLNFIMHGINIQNNKSKQPVHKNIFLTVFEKIWFKAPDNVKLNFLIERTKAVMSFNGSNIPILKFSNLNLSDNDLEQGEENSDSKISAECKELAKDKNFKLVLKFINTLIVSDDEFKKFSKEYMDLRVAHPLFPS